MARFNVDTASISTRMALVATVAFVMLVALIAAMLLVVPRPESDGEPRITDEVARAGIAEGSPRDQSDIDAPIAALGGGASSADRHDIEFRRDRLYGNLGFDTITPIYSPEYALASEARVHDDTFVIGLAIDGEARAYPVSILNRHEMVNDVVGGVPVLVTW